MFEDAPTGHPDGVAIRDPDRNRLFDVGTGVGHPSHPNPCGGARSNVSSPSVKSSDPDDICLFHAYRRRRDERVRNQIVVEHYYLAERCARRFAHRGESFADLCQVACLGLVKAVERFDPDRGTPFVSFAMPTISGEIKRHFRDHSWAVSVPRGAKEHRTLVQHVEQQLEQRLGRTPTVAEVAAATDLSEEQITRVRSANVAYRTDSLVHSSERPDPDADPDHVDGITALDAISTLDERLRTIMYLRFYEDRTQREIGERMGVNQVQVSRLIRTALDQLRARFEVREPVTAGSVP